MDIDEVRSKVESLGKMQPWNHNFRLAGGVQTRPGEFTSHGKNEIKFERLKWLFDLIDLEGKDVLDVGCNEGFFSFFMSSEGASVLGIDVDEARVEKAKFIASLSSGDVPDFRLMDIYSSEFASLKSVEFVLCLGFLHRVPDPVSAIAQLASKADMILFEWKALKHGPHTQSYAFFSEKPIDELDYFGTEYWLLSYAALENILKRNGFSHFLRVDDATQRRAILLAGRHANHIFDQKDKVVRRSLLKILGRHTREYFRTLVHALTGKLNA